MIKQAIIPLAGLGTRMLPLTSVLPKELLPINGKPNLEYILEECLEAGIKEFIFIISKKKLSIKKYFFNDNFYKKIIKKKKDIRPLLAFSGGSDSILLLYFSQTGVTNSNQASLSVSDMLFLV